ncbi:MAG TPA: response regulator [Gemmatimonadales bacterium]|nr:response regulator [Gemmatimonadales bacterium]
MGRGGSRRKVLFVEDDPLVRTMYERFFSSVYELTFAGSGSQALQALKGFTPDVVVLDMRLPDTDGVALFQAIRSTHPVLPVIVTTAYVSVEPLLKMLDLEHAGYLVKPFQMDELAARINAIG